MRHHIARTFFPYGAVRTVLRGPARGLRFVVAPAMGWSFAFASGGMVPPVLPRFLRPGMTVFDVGANRGQMALICAPLVGPGGRVLAFEPAPTEFTALTRNVSLNDLAWVRCIQVAASDGRRERTLVHDAAHPTCGKLVDVEPSYRLDGTAMTVQGVPLDDYLDPSRPPDLIKIDVEGAAGDVLRGAARILDDHAPAILIELHGPQEQAAVRDELIARGYTAATYDGERVADPTIGWRSPLWCVK